MNATDPILTRLQAQLERERGKAWTLLDPWRHLRLRTNGDVPHHHLPLNPPPDARTLLAKAQITVPGAELCYLGKDADGERLYCVLAWWRCRRIVSGWPENFVVRQ